jgi:hypothetical protein
MIILELLSKIDGFYKREFQLREDGLELESHWYKDPLNCMIEKINIAYVYTYKTKMMENVN